MGIFVPRPAIRAKENRDIVAALAAKLKRN